MSQWYNSSYKKKEKKRRYTNTKITSSKTAREQSTHTFVNNKFLCGFVAFVLLELLFLLRGLVVDHLTMRVLVLVVKVHTVVVGRLMIWLFVTAVGRSLLFS